MAEDAYGTITVDYATAEEARTLAGKSPWSCRWRPRPDGAVELLRVVDRRNVILLVRGDAEPERLAESAAQSKTSELLQFGCIATFALVFFAFMISRWLFVGAAIALVAFAIGRRLNQRPDLLEWAEEQHSTGPPWVTVPRKVGDPMPTGSQLIAACGLADAHGESALYRDRGDGAIEVATRGNPVQLRTLDRFGREIDVRALPFKGAVTARQLRRRVLPPSEWHSVRTDEPSSD